VWERKCGGYGGTLLEFKMLVENVGVLRSRLKHYVKGKKDRKSQKSKNQLVSSQRGITVEKRASLLFGQMGETRRNFIDDAYATVWEEAWLLSNCLLRDSACNIMWGGGVA